MHAMTPALWPCQSASPAPAVIDVWVASSRYRAPLAGNTLHIMRVSATVLTIVSSLFSTAIASSYLGDFNVDDVPIRSVQGAELESLLYSGY